MLRPLAWILVAAAVAALQVPWVRCIAESHEHMHVDLGKHASCACDHDHHHDHGGDTDEHEHKRVSWDVATSKVGTPTHVLPLIGFVSYVLGAPGRADGTVAPTPHPLVEPDAGRGTVLLL